MCVSLTGMGIFDNSFPMQVFIMLHRLRLKLGLSGMRFLRARFGCDRLAPSEWRHSGVVASGVPVRLFPFS